MFLASISYSDTTDNELYIIITELFNCKNECLSFVLNYITNLKNELMKTFEDGDLEYIEDRYIFEYKIKEFALINI